MPIDRVWWRLARSPSIANAPGASTPAANPWKARRARSWPGVETKSYRYSDPAVSSIPATTRRLRSSLSSSTPAPTLPARLEAEYMPTIAPPNDAVAPSDCA